MIKNLSEVERRLRQDQGKEWSEAKRPAVQSALKRKGQGSW